MLEIRDIVLGIEKKYIYIYINLPNVLMGSDFGQYVAAAASAYHVSTHRASVFGSRLMEQHGSTVTCIAGFAIF